jgi:hypothetical protein
MLSPQRLEVAGIQNFTRHSGAGQNPGFLFRPALCNFLIHMILFRPQPRSGGAKAFHKFQNRFRPAPE